MDTIKNPIDAYLEEVSQKRKSRAAKLEERIEAHGLLGELFKEHNRFALISIALLVVGCLGGVAVALGALASIPQLILLVIPTMATLALILAVAPMKQIVYAGIGAVIIDIAVILVNILG